MKIQTSKMTDAALDWAVCAARGLKPTVRTVIECGNELTTPIFLGDQEQNPSRNWAQGGPIMEQNRVQILIDRDGNDFAVHWMVGIGYGPRMDGPTPLIAGMRCLVASKMGSEVDMPKELVAHLPEELRTHDRSHLRRP